MHAALIARFESLLYRRFGIRVDCEPVRIAEICRRCINPSLKLGDELEMVYREVPGIEGEPVKSPSAI